MFIRKWSFCRIIHRVLSRSCVSEVQLIDVDDQRDRRLAASSSPCRNRSANERTILESSLKSQSEMQPCKLNDSESRPNITLKKIRRELDVAETKYPTLRSELNYMTDVCWKGQMEAKGSKETFDIPHEQISPSSKSRDISVLSPRSALFSSREIFNDAEVAKCEVSKEETQKGLFNVTITPRTQLDKMLPPAITTMPIQNKTVEASLDREYKSILASYPEHVREYLQSMLSVKDSVKKLASSGAVKDCFCVTSSCIKEDGRELELNLDTSEATRARQAMKCKYALGMTPRNEMNSTCKTSDVASKIRKRRGKLRGSVSKSTVTTKDTCPLSRKGAKRRKNKGHGVARQQSSLLKHTKRSNDVVEIFHNTTLKNSNSKVSTKHSKFIRGAKYAKKQNPAETIDQKTREKSYSEHVPYQFCNKENRQNLCLKTLNCKSDPRVTTANIIQEQNKSGKHFKNLSLETSNCQSSPRITTDSIQEQNKSGKNFNDLSFERTSNHESNPRVTADNVQKQHKSEKHFNNSLTQSKIVHQHERIACSRLNDSMSTPNYEMPTLASKLKRSNKSYFGRFNFHNIPFVVSTSVTPSHNLGLNIQQVLSVMKTRQPIMKDIAPLLIHRVSRSMKPMSTFLEQINVQCDRSMFDLKSQFNDKESLNVKQDRKLSVLELQRVGQAQSVHTAEFSIAKTIPESDNGSGQFCKEKGDFYEECKGKQRPSLIAYKNSTSAYSRNQRRISRMSLSKEDNIGDHKTDFADSHNSKEIRDVLVKLHDQFEEMNTRHDKLQSEVEKSDDATLSKELSTLEKELHVKEEEISAVISFYKEVMSLKQQMKMLSHKKSSLVCVETNSSIEPHRNPFSISFAPGKSYLTNIVQILGRRRGSNVYGAMRDPPTSVQLVALLRQIQAFHKQSQIVS